MSLSELQAIANLVVIIDEKLFLSKGILSNLVNFHLYNRILEEFPEFFESLFFL